MEIDEVLEYAATLPYVEEEYKPTWGAVLMKVGGKMFMLIPLEVDVPGINLKCDPEWAEELRMHHQEVLPGYHMNKRHWNTVMLRGNLSTALIQEMIRHSYELVYNKLPRKIKEGLSEEI